MGQAFQVLLDSGGLYLALGAILCIVIGIGAAKRLFQGAKRAEAAVLASTLTRKFLESLRAKLVLGAY